MARVEISGDLAPKIRKVFGEERKQAERLFGALHMLHDRTRIGIGGGVVREACQIQNRDLRPQLEELAQYDPYAIMSKDALGYVVTGKSLQTIVRKFRGEDIDLFCFGNAISSGGQLAIQCLNQCGVIYKPYKVFNGTPIVEIEGEGGKITFVSEPQARHNTLFPRVGKVKAEVGVVGNEVGFVGCDDDSEMGNLGENALKIDGIEFATDMGQMAVAVMRAELMRRTLTFPNGLKVDHPIKSEVEAMPYREVFKALCQGMYRDIPSVRRDWLLVTYCC